MNVLTKLVLKYMAAVEIGAYLAYMGHYRRTKDENILLIAFDELEHLNELYRILKSQNSDKSHVLNSIMEFIGTTTGKLCQVCPIWSLNWVASLLEKINVLNYGTVAKLYPTEKKTFLRLLEAEREHDRYFSGLVLGKGKL